MPAKKKTETAKAATKDSAAPSTNAQGIPLGRPAFGANVTSIAAEQPAGAVQLQIPNYQQKEQKAGSSTLTLLNPQAPTAAAKTVTPPKRG